jgi:hypothetical protein
MSLARTIFTLSPSSSIRPANTTRCCSPARCTCRRKVARSGPSPTISSRASGTRDKTECHAAIAKAWPFVARNAPLMLTTGAPLGILTWWGSRPGPGLHVSTSIPLRNTHHEGRLLYLAANCLRAASETNIRVRLRLAAEAQSRSLSASLPPLCCGRLYKVHTLGRAASRAATGTRVDELRWWAWTTSHRDLRMASATR